MKTQIALSLSIVWIVLSFLVGIQPMSAQNEPVLSGSKLRSEDVAAKADVVFVGEITAIGFGDTKAEGESAYRGVQVKVLQVLQGTVAASITVTLHVVGMMEYHEDPPKVGNSYIFFVKKSAPGQHDAYTVFKLLSATDANIAKIKTLIAAAPAGK